MTTRAIWSIRKFAPGLAILGSGGISSAASTVQMLHAGASVVQICSAVQNQDFTIIDDYMTGLKSHLYVKSRGDLESKTYQNSWPSRVPWKGEGPDAKAVKNQDVPPALGPFNRDRAARRQEFWKNADPSVVKAEAPCNLPDIEALPVVPRSKILPLSESVGQSHRANMRMHSDLTRDEQVVAVVNDDLCIQCGKCYMTCNDSGYQAIILDESSRLPEVDEDRCTGCGLCQAVCPAPGAIEYIPMGRRFMPKRGLEIQFDRYRDEGKSLK